MLRAILWFEGLSNRGRSPCFLRRGPPTLGGMHGCRIRWGRGSLAAVAWVSVAIAGGGAIQASEITNKNSAPSPETSTREQRPDARVWATHSTPFQGVPEAIGGFSDGCVQGAESLPMDGHGYQVMRLSRNRYYGHPRLLNYIRNFGRVSKDSGLGTVLIGDLGLPRGGWMQSGHASHQSGLDVDIWYDQPRAAQQRKLSRKERERISAQNLVPVSYTRKLNRKAFTSNTVKLIELAASAPEVDRVFVNAAIKAELCRLQQEKSPEWLRKIRPWYGHADHMHVRLGCPVDSPKCRPQDPLPPGSGCDASLDWWFTADAREEARKNALKARENPGPPAVPADCMRLATQQ